MVKQFHFNKNEAKHCLNLIDKNNPKDNMMFLGNNNKKKEVFLMLHGTLDGRVQYNNVLLNLEQLYQVLKKENTFYLITQIWGIKCINIICCHSYYIDNYEENGISLKTVFNNKEYVEVTLDTTTNECCFKEVS